MSRSKIVKKGLTRKEAMAKYKPPGNMDFRGFTYDPKTGKATWT